MTAQHDPTPEKRAIVQALAQFGIPQEQIARKVGVSEKTLRKHYAIELEDGATAANLAVAKNLYAFAAGSKGAAPQQVTAGIFWAKTRMGWRETQDVNHNHSFADGARERLAGKLGVTVAPEREEEAPRLDAPIGRA